MVFIVFCLYLRGYKTQYVLKVKKHLSKLSKSLSPHFSIFPCINVNFFIVTKKAI